MRAVCTERRISIRFDRLLAEYTYSFAFLFKHICNTPNQREIQFNLVFNESRHVGHPSKSRPLFLFLLFKPYSYVVRPFFVSTPHCAIFCLHNSRFRSYFSLLYFPWRASSFSFIPSLPHSGSYHARTNINRQRKDLRAKKCSAPGRAKIARAFPKR